ncbi:hypothetical protein [Nocardia brevicatena]|uniref:hypothetical protein n=1 Tax=Nocardia brevicatena TaxID=37327 RepID=UPI0002FC85BD|nr:hypothetical protein [Nocardia brevicatena]
MSDQPTTDPTDAEVPADAAPETPDTDAEQQPEGREAAKYRRRLRETETERDSFRERVAGYERAEVERLAAEMMADPSDLWVAGTELDNLRGKDGAIDEKKVRDTIQGLLEQRPHWKRAQRTHTPARGLKSGATGRSDTLGTDWSQAFAQARGE